MTDIELKFTKQEVLADDSFDKLGKIILSGLCIVAMNPIEHRQRMIIEIVDEVTELTDGQ